MNTITLSPAIVSGMELALGQDFIGVESYDRMAWIVLLLKKLEDRPEWFPRGKWATIQEIERQLDHCADTAIGELARGEPS